MSEDSTVNEKLLVILDMDHIIAHSTTNEKAKILLQYPKFQQSLHTFSLENEELANLTCYLKLRPHVSTFLETVKKYYRIAIYSMGLQTYVEKIMDILDPNKEIFEQKYMCRENMPSEINTKNISKYFDTTSSFHSFAVVVDDDEHHVWKECNQVISTMRYVFWPKEDTNISNDSNKYNCLFFFFLSES